MHLSRRDREIDLVQRDDAAEGFADAADAHDRRPGIGRRGLLERRRRIPAGYLRRVLSAESGAVLPPQGRQQSGNAMRQIEQRDENDHRKDQQPVLLGAMQQFRHQRQKRGAEHRAGQSPGTSEQDRQQKEHGIHELEIVRIDEILQMGKQRAAAAGKHCADDEHHDLLAMHVDADRGQGRLR